MKSVTPCCVPPVPQMAAADTREGGSEPASQSEEAPPGERVDEEQGGATPSAEDAEAAAAAKKPRRFSFLHLHIGERPFGIGGAHAAASAPTPVGSRHRHRRWSEAVFSVVSSRLPTFTFTGADDDSVSTSHSLGNHRRFSFANLRKFSGTVSLSSVSVIPFFVRSSSTRVQFRRLCHGFLPQPNTAVLMEKRHTEKIGMCRRGKTGWSSDTA